MISNYVFVRFNGRTKVTDSPLFELDHVGRSITPVTLGPSILSVINHRVTLL
jgi:hypothetical protein